MLVYKIIVLLDIGHKKNTSGKYSFMIFMFQEFKEKFKFYYWTLIMWLNNNMSLYNMILIQLSKPHLIC